MNRRKIQKVLNRFWQSGSNLEKEIIHIDDEKDLINDLLALHVVVNCVYVVTERDNYGEQTFKGVFANKEKAIEYLAKEGLEESNIDEINEIELN